MLSMDELRAIAQASHIDAIDGPREQEAGAAAQRATPQDDAWADRTAPPSVFTPAVTPGAGQAPHGRASQGHAPYTQTPYAQAPQGHSPHAQAPHGQGASGAVPPPPGAAPPPAVPPPFAAQPAPPAGGAGTPGAPSHPSGPSHPGVPSYPGAPVPAGGPGSPGMPPPVNGAAQPQPPPKKPGLPVLAIVFVVLSALIVLGIGGWILADALGRDDTASQQAAPPPPVPSTSELVEGSEAPPADPDAVAFVTPSGNIGCTIDDERARCVIREFDYGPPAAPDGCSMEDWGSIVVANHEGAGFSCTPADFPTSGQTLDYGESVSAHGMTCESSESGVACRSDESNASFSIARATADFTQK